MKKGSKGRRGRKKGKGKREKGKAKAKADAERQGKAKAKARPDEPAGQTDRRGRRTRRPDIQTDRLGKS